MKLPYDTATGGERALAETQRLLARFKVQSFGTMVDYDRDAVVVQFRFRDVQIHIEASIKGYAEAWLRAHPYSRRTRSTRGDYEHKAKRIAENAVYSILRDWIKGQVTAIETGVITFEGAFLGQILLPNGRTVHTHLVETRMLPASTGTQ